MASGSRDQALALAGVFQATQLVKQIAWEGSTDQTSVEHSLRSIFVTDADAVDEVYGGVAGVRLGLGVLRGQLGGDAQSRDIEVTRYTATLLHLERRLSRDARMLEAVGTRIETARELLEQYPATHPVMAARLAGIYQDTISTLSPRIMVNGEHAHLSNEETASRIRALLLAGIRSAVLWRQCGGSRLRLLIGRAGLLHAAETLIHSILQ